MVRTFPPFPPARKRPVAALGLALALGASASAETAADSSGAAAAADPLPALVAEALKNNPELQAARLESEVARAEGAGLSALPPPQAGIEFFEAPVAAFPDPLSDQAEIDYFVQQAFPFPGKRAAAREPARIRAEAEAARARELEVQVAREVKGIWFDLWRLEALRRVNADNQSLVRRFVEIASRQYEVGLGAQADILMAHSELASLAGEALDLAEAREEARGRLNALLARPPEGDFAPPTEPAVRVGDLTFEAVHAAARRRHPSLAMRRAEADMRAAEARSARRERLPDLMVRGMYKDMRAAPLHGGRPEDAWAVMLSVDLPLAPWSAARSRAGYRAAEARAGQARLGRAAEENRLAAEIRAALARHRAAGERLELARSALVPHAEQALQGLQAAYTTGKAGFMDLFAAYRLALAARKDEREAMARVMRSRADLEAAAGASYEELEAAAAGGAGPAGRKEAP